MARSHTPIQHPVPFLTLRVNDLLFVNEYFRNGQNATQAYLRVHPNAKYSTAETNSRRVLGKARVKDEIRRRIEYETGISRSMLERDLLWARDMALQTNDYDAVASITMDCAKLAGYLTEKHEVTHLNPEQQSAVSDFVQSMLSSERRPPVTNGHGNTQSTPTPPDQ